MRPFITLRTLGGLTASLFLLTACQSSAPAPGPAPSGGEAHPKQAASTSSPPAAAPAPTPAPTAQAAVPGPTLPAPVKIRRWPKLQTWLRGKRLSGDPTESIAVGEAELARHGKLVYGIYCVNCHGKEGRGDGPRSAVFDPPPRDLTRGVFKFRSTISGDPPTREDLFRTITTGLRGTGMVPFGDIPEVDRWALVAYVRSLSTIFEEADDIEVVELPPVPEQVDSPGRAQKGKAVYAKLECTKCHGESGRGDGPAAKDLKDIRGWPVKPRDFATRPFKRGNDPASIFMTVSSGLDGTPMPSFADSVSADDLWSLTAYVRSLQREGRRKANPTDMAEARRIVAGQQQQGQHATQGGCGCNARRRAKAGGR